MGEKWLVGMMIVVFDLQSASCSRWSGLVWGEGMVGGVGRRGVGGFFV